MNIEATIKYSFDDMKEEERLRNCFSGDILKRQLDILNNFRAGEWTEVCKLMEELPHDGDYPEIEYVCLFIYAIINNRWGDGDTARNYVTQWAKIVK